MDGLQFEQAGLEFAFGIRRRAYFAVRGAEREFVGIGEGVGFVVLVGLHEDCQFFYFICAFRLIFDIIRFFYVFELLFEFALFGFEFLHGGFVAIDDFSGELGVFEVLADGDEVGLDFAFQGFEVAFCAAQLFNFVVITLVPALFIFCALEYFAHAFQAFAVAFVFSLGSGSLAGGDRGLPEASQRCPPSVPQCPSLYICALA